MKIKKAYVNHIPTLLYGKTSNKIFIYVHGKHADKEEANSFSDTLTKKGYQVLSFDLPEHGERKKDINYQCNIQNAVSDLLTIFSYVSKRYDSISLYACSLGAYFSLVAYSDVYFEKCLFLSPILDMQKLIEKMMINENISETRLLEEKEIQTNYGETLSWEYYNYVKEHPVTTWKSTTYILYGEHDFMTDRLTLDEFANKFQAETTVMKNSEHYFHTPKQLLFLDNWINEKTSE